MSDIMEPKLSGSPNLRDLGGHTTADGHRVRRGLVYRSGALSTLTDADVDVLAGLDLRTVIDFRLAGEVHNGGADRLPPGLIPLALPVGGGNLEGFYALAMSGDPDQVHRQLGDGRAAEAMADMYRGFVSNAEDRLGFAATLRTLTEAQSLPLLFHCTAGKDRTGWLSAIVLTILGVPRAEVMADFLLSNEYFLPVADAQLSNLGVPESGLTVFRPLLEQHPSYLEAAFTEAEARFGSFEDFVHKGLDMPEAPVARLREQLLEPDSA